MRVRLPGYTRDNEAVSSDISSMFADRFKSATKSLINDLVLVAYGANLAKPCMLLALELPIFIQLGLQLGHAYF